MERREKDVAGGRERVKRKKERVLLVVIRTSSDSDGGSQMAKKPNQCRQSYLGQGSDQPCRVP